jgi:hypothetical protein
MSDTEWIYILKLCKNKYYVGRTKNVEKRFEEHKDGTGSVWTKKYKPELVEDSFVGDRFDEDKHVKICMEKYGIENVRGGSYSCIKLSVSQIKLLANEIKGAENLCFKCGSVNHFAESCGKKPKVKRKCGRCGRIGHNRRKCYAKTHFDGTLF